MVVMEGWECPTVCKKEEGIVREGEMSGEYVREKCPDPEIVAHVWRPISGDDLIQDSAVRFPGILGIAWLATRVWTNFI